MEGNSNMEVLSVALNLLPAAFRKTKKAKAEKAMPTVAERVSVAVAEPEVADIAPMLEMKEEVPTMAFKKRADIPRFIAALPVVSKTLSTVAGDHGLVVVSSIEESVLAGTVLDRSAQTYMGMDVLKAGEVVGRIAINVGAVRTLAIEGTVTKTHSDGRTETFQAIRLSPALADINRELMNVKPGKQKYQQSNFIDNLAETLLASLSAHTRDIALRIQNWGDPLGYKIQGIWICCNRMPLLQMGLTVELAKEFATAQHRMLIEASEKTQSESRKAELAAMAAEWEIGITHPERLNGIKMWAIRYPINWGLNITPMVIRIIDLPGRALVCSAETAKLLLGDFDGDCAKVVFGVDSCTLRQATECIANNNFHGLGRVMAAPPLSDYDHISTRVIKKGITHEVNFRNTSFLWKGEEDYRALIGYMVKSYIADCDTVNKMYSAALAQFLFSEVISTEELIAVSNTLPESLMAVKPLIDEAKARMKRCKPGSKGFLAARNMLARQCVYASMKDIFESVFDIRKADTSKTIEETLGFDPVSTLIALQRATNKVDWKSLASEKAGIWVQPLQLVAKYLGTVDPLASMEKEEVVLKYNIRKKLSEMNPDLDAIWVQRMSWKKGTVKDEVIYNLIQGEVPSFDNILNIIQGQFDNCAVSVEQYKEGRPLKHKEYRPNWEAAEGDGFSYFSRQMVGFRAANAELQKYNLMLEFDKKHVLFVSKFRKNKGNPFGQDNAKPVGQLYVSNVGNAQRVDMNGITRVCKTHLHNAFASIAPKVMGEYQEQENTERDGYNPLTDGFYTTDFWGHVAHLIIQGDEDFITLGHEATTRSSSISVGAERVKEFLFTLPVVDELGLEVLSDEIELALPEEGNHLDKIQLDFAAYCRKAGFSLFSTSKSHPGTCFSAIYAEGLTRAHVAMDPFAHLSNLQRTPRELRAFLCDALEMKNPRGSNVHGSILSPEEFHGELINRRQMAFVAVFDCAANKGNADDVHCTYDGQRALTSSHIFFKSMSELEYTRWQVKMEKKLEEGKITQTELDKLYSLVSEKIVQKGQGWSMLRYRVPMRLGELQAMHFKVQTLGTKGIAQAARFRMAASHFSPLQLQLENKTAGEQIRDLGLVPVELIFSATTVVGKQSHMLLHMAASLLEEYVVNPHMTATELAEDISTKLVTDNINADGLMFLYFIDGDDITPVLDADGKFAQVPCGFVPIYRPDFQADETWTKIADEMRLSHDELALIGERPIINNKAKATLALDTYSYELCKGLL